MEHYTSVNRNKLQINILPRLNLNKGLNNVPLPPNKKQNKSICNYAIYTSLKNIETPEFLLHFPCPGVEVEVTAVQETDYGPNPGWVGFQSLPLQS